MNEAPTKAEIALMAKRDAEKAKDALIAELRAELEKARANERRYLWLRNESNEECSLVVHVPETEGHEDEWRNVVGDEMDAAIDAAMQKWSG